MNKKIKLAFLASGGGSNMQAIIDAINNEKLDAIAELVISNNSDSGALEKAKAAGIAYKHISAATCGSAEAADKAIAKELLKHKIDYVVLAGYMKIIGEAILSEFPNRILNIHPALLPDFGGEGMYGMNVHRAVIAAKAAESGATVHLINNEYDKGRILAQMCVPVLETDTAEDLQKRVLAVEHIIYAETLQKIANNEIEI